MAGNESYNATAKEKEVAGVAFPELAAVAPVKVLPSTRGIFATKDRGLESNGTKTYAN